MRFLVRRGAEAQGSCSKAVLVSTGWHRDGIRCSTAEILTASTHIEVRIICYHQHHRAVLLCNGHLSTSPPRNYLASFQSCQQLPLPLHFQKFDFWTSLFLPFLLQLFWICMEKPSPELLWKISSLEGPRKASVLQFPGPAQSGMNSK